MIAYVDCIVILGDTDTDIFKITEKLIEYSHIMNLVLYENKTKYLIDTRSMGYIKCH